jgi:hypothetical protein
MKPFKGWLSANDADIRVPQTHHIDGVCGEILHHKPTLKFMLPSQTFCVTNKGVVVQLQVALYGGTTRHHRGIGGANKLKLNFVSFGRQFTSKILLAE